MFGDALAVREDLRALRVLLSWDVAQLLEQRHVHVRLDIAGDTRIPIPVPGASHVGGLVDQPDALHAQFAESGTGEKPSEPGADNRDVDLVGQRVADEILIAPRIVREVGKRTGDLDVLLYAIGTQPALPLKGVFLPQSSYVEFHARHLAANLSQAPT
jgi:hypothetical protein